MACVTIKRGLDFDPFGSSARSAKRRRCTPISLTPKSETKASPFGLVSPKLTSESIAKSVRDELRRLQRRRQLVYPANDTDSSGSDSDTPRASAVVATAPCCSPISGRTPAAASSRAAGGHLSPASPSVSCSAAAAARSPLAKHEKPLFNFREVGMICERILRDREEHIREEYDKVLSSKLQEQYDMFVRFTQDQIVKNYAHNHAPSYLS